MALMLSNRSAGFDGRTRELPVYSEREICVPQFNLPGRRGRKIVNKNRLGLIVAAVALAASTCFACGEDAKADDAKDVKAVAATGTATAPVTAIAPAPAVAAAAATGCDMPCCAHAKDAAKPDVLAAADVKPVAQKDAAMPCAAAAAAGCPKKAATTGNAVAKAEPAQDAAKSAPAVDPGTKR